MKSKFQTLKKAKSRVLDPIPGNFSRYGKVTLLSLAVLFISNLQPLSSQENEDLLRNYIDSALANNLALKQKEANWEESLYALQEARGLFFPDLSLNARYSVADGGRVIDFPVGDLLNPVYSTLNRLTSGNQFTMIENEKVPFLRPQEHETKLRLVQPLLNTDIYYNRELKRNQASVMKADLDTYRRNLVSEIKTAYYDYLKALEIFELLEETRIILEENIRVNQSLFENDKVTRDYIYRSNAELSKLEENIAEAQQGVTVFAAYFNFLLNRDLNTDIEIMAPGNVEITADLEGIINQAITIREEIEQLDYYSELAENNVSLNRSGGVPELIAVVDYGFQGEEYRFTSEDDFVMASLVLRWDLFKGFQQKNKISQSKVMLERVQTQREETVNLIRLEILNAWYAVLAGQEKVEAASDRELAAKEAFKIVRRKYEENQSSFLEFLDARNTMTSAGQDLIISRYELLSAFAKYERSAGLYNFNNTENNDSNE